MSTPKDQEVRVIHKKLSVPVTKEEYALLQELMKDEGFQHESKGVIFALMLYKYGKQVPDAILKQTESIEDLRASIKEGLDLKKSTERQIWGDNQNHLLSIENSEKLDKILALLGGK